MIIFFSDARRDISLIRTTLALWGLVSESSLLSSASAHHASHRFQTPMGPLFCLPLPSSCSLCSKAWTRGAGTGRCYDCVAVQRVASMFASSASICMPAPLLQRPTSVDSCAASGASRRSKEQHPGRARPGEPGSCLLQQQA